MPSSYDNCKLSASGYGSRTCKVETVGFGIEIIATGSSARHHRALYTTRRIPSGFSISVVLTSYAEYEGFAKWMQGYGRSLTDADASVSQVMRVMVPSRGFDQSGVPAGAPVLFGMAAGEFVWRMAVNFVGTHDPSEPRPSTSAMEALPENAVPYFYPGGVQLAGTQQGTDFLYNYEQTAEHMEAILNPATRPVRGAF